MHLLEGALKNHRKTPRRRLLAFPRLNRRDGTGRPHDVISSVEQHHIEGHKLIEEGGKSKSGSCKSSESSSLALFAAVSFETNTSCAGLSFQENFSAVPLGSIPPTQHDLCSPAEVLSIESVALRHWKSDTHSPLIHRAERERCWSGSGGIGIEILPFRVSLGGGSAAIRGLNDQGPDQTRTEESTRRSAVASLQYLLRRTSPVCSNHR